MASDLKVVAFKKKEAFHLWLKKNSKKKSGIWLKIFKKDSGKKSISYQEALEEALCYGWIDGQAKSFDDESWLRKFTPRSRKSTWSQRNTLIVQRLIDEGRMRASGFAVVQEAKESGSWHAAYASPKEMVIPVKYLKIIKADRNAYALYKTLNKSQLYSIALKLHTAKKEETRERRLKAIIETLQS